jgi:cbb3-type cytochrome oxidase maturation protein
VPCFTRNPMEVIYGLIPGMLILGLVAVGVLFWAVRSGQFDDPEGDAYRILMDDDAEMESRNPSNEPGDGSEQDGKSDERSWDESSHPR